MSRRRQAMRRLMVAVVVVHALLLAGLSPSHAAAHAAAHAPAAHSSRNDLVDGVPCNDLCKAYMAWSDRMLARLRPPRRQAQPPLRTAAHAKKPQRTAHHAAAARQLDLNSFAQLPRRGGAVSQPTAPRPVEMAALQPTDLSANRASAADGAAERRANADSAATEFPETMPVSVADPNPPTQEPVTTGQVAGHPPARLAIALVLALCALLAFGSSGWMSWGWIRSRRALRAQSDNTRA